MDNTKPYDPRLPWRFEGEDRWYNPNKIINADGTVVTHDETYYPSAPCDDDMKFIVTACNAHNTLVTALETALAGLLWYIDMNPDQVGECGHEAITQINAALELAKVNL